MKNKYTRRSIALKHCSMIDYRNQVNAQRKQEKEQARIDRFIDSLFKEAVKC